MYPQRRANIVPHTNASGELARAFVITAFLQLQSNRDPQTIECFLANENHSPPARRRNTRKLVASVYQLHLVNQPNV